MAAVLSLYPEEVITHATDPRTGLASRCRWLPHVYEVREICDELLRPLQDAERRRRIAEETLAVREVDRGGRETLDELRARHGTNWGIVDRDPMGTKTKMAHDPMATLLRYGAEHGVDGRLIRGMPAAPRKSCG